MAKWKQVSGDMDFSGVGCVLARDNGSDVDLVKIDPWLELDSSALKDGYDFWCVDTTTIDYDNMGVENKDVQSALSYVGMDAEEYEKLEPVYKAEIIASASGYGDSRSTSDYADALPVPLGEIGEVEFWSEKKLTPKKIADINDEMRHAVVYKVYGGDFDEKKLPDDDALELAWGEGQHTFDISEDDAQAVRYALAIARQTFDWDPPKPSDTKLVVEDAATFKSLLEALRDAPDSADQPAENITRLAAAYEGSFKLDWEDKREQVAYMIDEDAKAARSLIHDLIQHLGF